MTGPPLEEGWYLISVAELEQELGRVRDPSRPPSAALPLSTDEALARRDAGNVPDADGRSLRLVLHVEGPDGARALATKRLRFEPDFHDAPEWRREGSVPVNVVPMRIGEAGTAPARPWWEEPDVAALEEQWRASGSVAGIKVPGEYRSFVYKTVLALQKAGRDVSVETVAGSIARWLGPDDADRIKFALEDANRKLASEGRDAP